MKSKLVALALAGGCLARVFGEPAPLVVREIIAPAGERSIRTTLVRFSPRDFALRVIDNGAPGDTGKYARLAVAMKALGGSAGCNGGFFEQRPFSPVGLMIADGSRAGSLDSQSWMKGLVVVRAGVLSLEETGTFRDGPAITQLLQSGPWLVRNGMAQPSSDTRLARRTFICRDLNDRWALGVTDPCTLADLASLLRSEPVAASLEIHEALNLDGGPSTGLWAQREKQEYSKPEKWTVRNYVALFPRIP